MLHYIIFFNFVGTSLNMVHFLGFRLFDFNVRVIFKKKQLHVDGMKHYQFLWFRCVTSSNSVFAFSILYQSYLVIDRKAINSFCTGVHIPNWILSFIFLNMFCNSQFSLHLGTSPIFWHTYFFRFHFVKCLIKS